ncbi:MAG: hypothetical protein K2M36_03440 [Clostridia bacterium]|nr:hypothetical protein [Clostridia bacterium]
MKTKFKIVAAIICIAICVLSLTACNNAGKSTLLGAPNDFEEVGFSELSNENYKTFRNSVEAFAADFAAYSYADYKKQDNFAVSPISVYMALSLAAQCASGDTRAEILNALGVTYEQLKTHFSTLYRSLEVEHKYGDTLTGFLRLTNSIWVNNSTQVKQPCIDALSNDFYSYSYSADFEHDSKQANKAVRDFVKKQTNGLIDKDFDLSPDTLFTLINTLYLKTIWNTHGDELPFAKGSYTFTAKDGSEKDVQLLQGKYNSGRAIEFDTFSTFFTETYNGYKIKFILPKDGYNIDQVFCAENIAAVNAITYYNAYDKDVQYSTRVLFPEYKCKYDENIADILKDKFDIDLLFKDHIRYSPACDFSTLTDESCYCDKIQHVTDLTVDRKGIEGAAVTVISISDSAPVPPLETVYNDFIVNKSFGFIITDRYDITLFSGVVNNI